MKNKKIILPIIIALISSLIFTLFIIVERNTIEFSLLGNTEVILEVGEEYTEEGFVATKKKNDISKKVKIKNNINNDKIGDYLIKYNLKIIYLYINKTLIRNVHVKDTTKPKLNIESDKQINLYVGDIFVYPNVSAIDNYDGNITSKIKMSSNLDINKEGQYEINYVISDSSNNTTEDKILINVIKKRKNPYINISITNQTLSYYEYGEIVLTSPIVTGKNDATPTGNYKVLSKNRNVTLRGSNYASFVNYWIAFIGHTYGIHDASWRNTFGGTIYKNNGSHGCVNMPHDKVEQLYNLVDIGTPVYIYY